MEGYEIMKMNVNVSYCKSTDIKCLHIHSAVETLLLYRGGSLVMMLVVMVSMCVANQAGISDQTVP